MGGRKFRLSTHEKNEEREKKREGEGEASCATTTSCCHPLSHGESTPLMVSLPIESYVGGHIQSSASMCSRLALVSLPASFVGCSVKRASHVMQAESTAGRGGFKGGSHHYS